MKFARVLWRLCRLLRPLAWGLWMGGKAHRRALQQNPVPEATQRLIQRWFSQVLQILNVQVSVQGRWSGAPRLVICNHISWLDILVLGSSMPIVFLSKEEVDRWPLICRLARAGGTLFIRRGATGAARHSIDETARAFHRQQSVLVFPEGTTSAGHQVLLYHPRLFAAAIEQQVPVQPAALRYPHPGGTHPAVPFIDDMLLTTSLWKILGARTIHAEVHLGETIAPGSMERRELAEAAHAFTTRIVAEGLKAS